MLLHALEQSSFNLQIKRQRFCSAITAITCRKTAISHRKTAISHMKTAITHRKLVSHIENCLVAGGCVLAARVLVRCSVDTPQLLSPLTPPPAPSLPGQEAASVRVSAEQQPATLTSLSLHSSPAQPSPPRTYPAPAALCRHLLDTSLCC